MTNTADTIHPVDAHVGQSIRRLRILRNMTQSEVAKAIGLSFQQLQKYETGANRVSASKLYTIAHILGATPSHFFEGLGEMKTSELHDLDLESAQIGAMIARITDDEVKANLRSLVKLIAPKDMATTGNNSGQDTSVETE